MSTYKYTPLSEIKPLNVSSSNSLIFLFTKTHFDAASDLWWILRQLFIEHPERFQLLDGGHISKDDDEYHINIGYMVTPKFQQTYHVYYKMNGRRTIYTHVTAEGLDRERLTIVKFSVDKLLN